MSWRLGRGGASAPDPDWSRTPAAMFACAVLGLASISGLAWSWNRALRQQPTELSTRKITVMQATPEPGGSAPRTLQTPRFDAVKRIDINTASLAQLDLLPGVGPAIGQKIIDYRRAHGPFGSVDDLRQVSGIGPRTVEKMRPLAVVGTESRASAQPGG